MEIIGRSGGKPGKQGKSKWAEPVKAEEKLIPAEQTMNTPEQKAEEKTADIKSEKAKEKKQQSRKEQKSAQALVDLLRKDKSTGDHKSIYFSKDNLEFLEMLKKKNGIQYSAVINMLVDDLRKKYNGSAVSDSAEEDE